MGISACYENKNGNSNGSKGFFLYPLTLHCITPKVLTCLKVCYRIRYIIAYMVESILDLIEILFGNAF